MACFDVYISLQSQRKGLCRWHRWQCQTRLSACSLKNGHALCSLDTVLHDCKVFLAEVIMTQALCQALHLSALFGSMHLDINWQRHVAHVSQNHCIITCFLLTLCCKSVYLHCLPCFWSYLRCQQYEFRMPCAKLQRKDEPRSSHVYCELNPNAHDPCARRVIPVLVNAYTMSRPSFSVKMPLALTNAFGVFKCPCWCVDLPCVLNRRAM